MNETSKALESCRIGNHDLVEILRSEGHETDLVASWCRTCGAVTVDHERDGRLMDNSMQMMAPLTWYNKS